ncbi:MAG: hypothetical protein K1X94_02620 [Sandaracinaceae bacterium]|nr:hypothetical protein [Sandaracinaceae bacterium]
MLRSIVRALSFVVLALLVLACCFGGGGGGPTVTRLDPWGVELESSFSGGVQPDGSYLFTSGDGSSSLVVQAAPPAGPAAGREALALLGHPATVQWTRPRTYAGMSGMEARVNDTVAGQVVWIGAFDAPGGVVVMRLSTSSQWIDSPTRGDPAWESLAMGVRPAR